MKQIDITLTEKDLDLLCKGGSIETDRVGVRVYVAAEGEAQTLRDQSVLDDLETIQPLRVYTAEEVRMILGTKRLQSVYEIPQEELPRARRIGRHYGYLGINVLAYITGCPPIDVGAAVEAYREKLMADRPQVQPLRSVDGERHRIQ